MDDKSGKNSSAASPSQGGSAQKPQKESVSYTKTSNQGAIGNLAGRMRGVFSNKTTAILAVVVLIVGLGAATLAVQRSTETRQHAATILPQGPCYPLGDVNVDGKVDIADSQLITKYVSGIPITGTFNQLNADVDKIGGITSVDALKISRYIAGFDPSFPGCPIPTATPTPRPTAVPTYTPAPTRAPTPTPLPPTPPPTISTRGPCYPLGDVDVDGDVDAADALLILRYVAALPNATFNQLNADVDRDGDIDSVDALKIQRYIAGLDTTFSGCGINPPTVAPTRVPTPTIRPTATPAPTAPPLPTPTTIGISPQGPCYPLGDADADGDVDPADSQLILRYVAGTTTVINQQNADVDRVGGITSLDSQIILRYIAGLISTFPGCGIAISTPTPAPINTADINRDGAVDLIDFNLWLRAFQKIDNPPYTANNKPYYPDINTDSAADLLDFNLWLRAYKA